MRQVLAPINAARNTMAGLMSRWDAGLARRSVAILVGAALVTGLVVLPGASSAMATAATGSSETATSMSTGSAIELLARNGIATVANESTTTPLQAVSGSVGIRFTEAQVSSMALGASDHAGISGSALNAMTPVTKGEPPFSYLLAAWVSTGTSSGAAAVRAVMGTQSWAQAPALVYPAIALPLFTANAMTAFGVPPAGAKAAQTTESDDPAASDSAALVGMGVVDAPCSLVSNFMQEVLDTVFENLKLSAPTGSSVIVKVGSFFVNLWDIAVTLAQKVVSGLVKAVGDSVVTRIAAAAAAADTIAQDASYITPWSAKVTAAPTSVALGGNSGSFKAVVSSGGGIAYPAAVRDCAGALHITLPSLSANGAKATWTLVGPLSPTTSTSPTLDKQGSNTLQYKTGLLPCGSPTPGPNEGHATITVSRPAIDTLKTLVNTWVASMVGQAGTLVKPKLQPLLDSISSELDNLTQVSATGTVGLTKPTGTDKSQTTCPCVIGTWRVLNETVSLAHESGGAGAIWTIIPKATDIAEGTATDDHNGSAPLINPEFKIQYSGTETNSFTIPPADVNATSGTWSVRAVSADLEATTTIGATVKTSKVPFDPGVTEEGTWTCRGDAMTASYAGVGETNTLTRISS